jgi:hypothetical protein
MFARIQDFKRSVGCAPVLCDPWIGDHAGFQEAAGTVRRLGRPPRWEMGEIMSESHPPVLRLLPNRYRRRWEVGVMKSTDCNADMVWPQVGFPKHRRSARRAKMHPNLSSLLPVADIDVGRSFGANMPLLEKGNNAEHRAGSPLTLATMAGAYSIRIGGYFNPQCTATAVRVSRHGAPPLAGATRSERPLTLDRAHACEISDRENSRHDAPPKRWLH